MEGHRVGIVAWRLWFGVLGNSIAGVVLFISTFDHQERSLKLLVVLAFDHRCGQIDTDPVFVFWNDHTVFSFCCSLSLGGLGAGADYF